MRAYLLISLVMVLGALSAQAQPEEQGRINGGGANKSYLYQWADDAGVVHITDGLDKVPTKYRDRAVMLRQSGTEDVSTKSKDQPLAPSGPEAVEVQIEADQKTVWQTRMKDARERLANLERRYQALEQKRTSLLGPYAPPADRAEAQRIEGEMKDVQQDIDAARNELTVTIPEEARKAGVPPGWLRE